MTEALFIFLAILVGVAGWEARRRLRRQKRAGVTDDVVRRIETLGWVDAEDVEPVDLDRARKEEDEFWAQTWDEPEDNL